MVIHKGFESDCKRIAREIQQEANNPTSDAVCYGTTEVIVSRQLMRHFACHKGQWVEEINKYLKGCKVKYETNGYGHGFFIVFNIEFDEVDAETEDW